MNGLFWVLVVGVTGWLTGKMFGGKGYGEALGGYTDGLDIIFGIVGASIGGYLISLAIIGEGSFFSGIATAILGSITLVAVVRLVPVRYWLSSSH
ncbi:MAG: GlsB/YeaQ/YmgE family stress response membrane protein [Candidatus Binatia bacterium]